VKLSEQMRAYAPNDPEIVRGRIWLLIAIGLIVLFIAHTLFNDWKQGKTIADLVEFPAVMALLCVFLYRGSGVAKGCLGVLLTFLVGIFSLGVYAWIAPFTQDLRREVLLPHLIDTMNRDFLIFCAGLVYCWWTLLFSESTKTFLLYQRAKRKKRR